MAEFDKKYDAKEKEPKIRQFWEENNIFKFDENSQKVVFSIDTPPPNISGRMHIGHAFSYTQTDFVARYKRMKGFEVFYPFGTDDNGLPTEKWVQKEKKINLRSIPREEAIKICMDFLKLKRDDCVNDWKNIGLSSDFSIEYSTIDDHSRKLSQKTFLDLYNKGLIVRQEGPVMWDRVFQTPIAQAELEDKEMTSSMNYIKAKVLNTDHTYMIYATTRPELLFACAGFSVEDEGDYVKLKVNGEFWIISAKTYEENLKKFGIDSFEVIEELKGQDMIGEKIQIPITNKEIEITHDVAVKADFGTGIAYFCSYGGLEDIEYFARHKLDPIQVLNQNGKLNEKCLKYEGKIASDARPQIIEDLKSDGHLIHSEKITHVVNVGERSGVEIEYIVAKQWYVNYLDKKDYFFEMTQKFNWHPEFMKHRLENWIKGLNWNWGFSRQRHFGIPVPVWHGEDSKKIYLPSENDLPIDPTGAKPNLKKNIYFLRHAHYDKNDKNVININPAKEFSLSEKGILATKDLREKIKINFDEIHVSEFLRTKQTADLFTGKDEKDFIVSAQLNEIALGKDGDSISTYHENIEKDLQRENSIIKKKQKELIKFIDELKSNDSQNILVVTHKDNLKLIKSYFENLSLDLFQDINFENLEIYHREFDFTPSEKLIPETDIMDTWFTSASTPFLAIELIKSEEMKKKLFPMNLRPQAHDIINFWLFYTMAKTNLLYDENPFKNVAVSGFVLDPQGKKMSKSKGNTIAPQDVVDKYSNDAIRFASASTKLGSDIPFQEKEVQTGIKVANKLYNANKFAAMLLGDFKREDREFDFDSLKSIDKWIIAKFQNASKIANDNFERYDYSRAKAEFEQYFMRDVADNYIEIVKTRLWNPDEYKESTKLAQKAIYYVLYNSLKGLAPIMPFITEEIYQIFYREFEEEKSIHITSYPEYNENFDVKDIIENGDKFVQIVGEARKFKAEKQLSMKAELSKIKITCDTKLKEFIEDSIQDLKSVTSAKEVEFLNGDFNVQIEE